MRFALRTRGGSAAAPSDPAYQSSLSWPATFAGRTHTHTGFRSVARVKVVFSGGLSRPMLCFNWTLCCMGRASPPENLHLDLSVLHLLQPACVRAVERFLYER